MKILLCDFATLPIPIRHSVREVLQSHGAHLYDAQEETRLSIEDIDACIVSGIENSMKTAYVTALALAQKKTVLCLIPKGERVHDGLAPLQQEKSIRRFFALAFYTPDSIRRIVQDFVAKNTKPLEEIPSVKFTLRITPSIERYLQWKSQISGESKADFLRRAIVERIMSGDAEYRNMLE
jgi:hypothetical protein